MKRWHRLTLLIAMLLSLAGCISFIAEGDPKWDPPILSKEGCPDLDGVYDDKGVINTYFYEENISIVKSDIRGRRKSEGLMTVEFLVSSLEYNKIFLAGGTYVSVQKKGDILEFVRFSKTGNPYKRTIVHLEHPFVGCHNGALLLRSFVIRTYP